MPNELAVRNEKTINDMLADITPKLSKVLSRGLSPERVTRVFLSEIRRNPKLADCSIASLANCLMETSSLGLEYGRVRKQMWLVPYGQEATNIVGYGGLIDFAMRSGQVKKIEAVIVHKNDNFRLTMGTDSKIEHMPNLDDPGEWIGAYAIAKVNGESQHIYMTRIEILKIRDRSAGWKSQGARSTWGTDEEEMAKKTAVRRLCKMLPAAVLPTEAVDYMEREDAREYENVIDATATQVDPLAPGRHTTRQPVQVQPATVAPAPVQEAAVDTGEVTDPALPEASSLVTPPTGAHKITDKQAKRLWAIAKSNKWEDAKLKELLDLYGIEHTRDIEMGKQYDEIIGVVSHPSGETTM